MKGTLAVTDADWLATLSSVGATEVNFWQPRPTTVREPEGTPWIFKVRGTNLVAGYGFFSYWTAMPLAVAWETFGIANGVRSYAEMARRVRSLARNENTIEQIGCVVLSDVALLPREAWIPAPSDWKPNIVRIARYDLSSGEGARVWSQVRALANTPATNPLLSVSGGFGFPSLVAPRRGQGAFRLMVIDAYERRCAITGERTLPALEAAHIRPFSEHQQHDVRNGILMRSDLHRLYDLGLVTVKPDLTFNVSRTIQRDYANGKIYYALDGKTISTPNIAEAKPDPEALAWHARERYRP